MRSTFSRTNVSASPFGGYWLGRFLPVGIISLDRPELGPSGLELAICSRRYLSRAYVSKWRTVHQTGAKLHSGHSETGFEGLLSGRCVVFPAGHETKIFEFRMTDLW